MSRFTQLFGSQLAGHDGSLDTETHLQGKHVLIYFSAHWCPPCRGFTPALAEFYNKHHSEKSFEIVFVSSDRDESSFNEYFGEMPWVALPFAERERKQKISSEFKVSGIPTLVVLTPEGETITTKGRGKVSGDPEANDFPWVPKTLSQILNNGSPLYSNSGEVAASSVQGKHFGIYFSAHWCPPCRGFTPKLVETYKKLKEDGKDFEVIFVSSDRDEGSYKEYFGEMPWLSIGYDDKRSSELSDACDVNGIPQLTLVNEAGEIVTHSGRDFVTDDPNGNEFPWQIKPLQKISLCGDEINSEPCVVGIFPEDKSEELVEMMKPIAEEKFQAHKDKKIDKIHFFYSVGAQGIAERICSLFSIDASNPVIVFLNIPSGYTTCEADENSLSTTVNSFLDGSLELKPLP